MNKLIIPSKTERLIQKNDFFLTRGHDFVEIGGVKWATCNIGAEKPTDPGFYFQWGNTKGCPIQELENISKDHFSSHCYRPNFGEICHTLGQHKIKLKDEYDAAHANWGGAWRMPTTEEFAKLKNATDFRWIRDYKKGTNGMLFIDKGNHSKQLFFPATGYIYDNKISLRGIDGTYWASDNEVDRGTVANTIITRDCGIRWNGADSCFYGFQIRAILN